MTATTSDLNVIEQPGGHEMTIYTRRPPNIVADYDGYWGVRPLRKYQYIRRSGELYRARQVRDQIWSSDPWPTDLPIPIDPPSSLTVRWDEPVFVREVCYAGPQWIVYEYRLRIDPLGERNTDCHASGYYGETYMGWVV